MSPPGRFPNKIAIVTGSSRGIGRAIAERLASEGARIVLTGRDESALAEICSKFRAPSPSRSTSANLRLRRNS